MIVNYVAFGIICVYNFPDMTRPNFTVLKNVSLFSLMYVRKRLSVIKIDLVLRAPIPQVRKLPLDCKRDAFLLIVSPAGQYYNVHN